jgi:hypothetical protein
MRSLVPRPLLEFMLISAQGKHVEFVIFITVPHTQHTRTAELNMFTRAKVVPMLN